MKANTARNLLFGVLALRMDFISRDDLIRAMNTWVRERDKPLGQVLVEQGALGDDQHTLLETLVREHLKSHGNDAEKSLAAVSRSDSIREELQKLGDPDLQASTVTETPKAEGGSTGLGGARAGTVAPPGLRFRILRPHARGGLGQVSLAFDEELHREVALKEIQERHADDPTSRRRFLLEAEITGRLEHPGIVPVYSLGRHADGRPFYAMRFIRGKNLQAAVDRFHQAEGPGRDASERALALRQLLRRFLDVCQAVAYAHGRGVLHRDLKPGNVMLGKYGETLVVDWGLAKALGQAEETVGSEEGPLRPASAAEAATRMGGAVGTPQYMSPEQAAGQLDRLGPASDVYSLGATLYYLLTGTAPFPHPRTAGLTAVLQKVQRGDFPPPRQLNPRAPRPLEAVCLKAMALRPEDRYASPRDLVDEIEHWLADEPVAAYREPWGQRLGRWVRRHWAGVQATAAALLVVAAVSAGAAVWVNTARSAAVSALAAEQVARQETKGALAAEQAARAAAVSALAAEQAALQRADEQRRLAEQGEATARRYWYVSDLNAAQQAWKTAHVARLHELLERWRRPPTGKEDLRSFDWYHLWHLSHGERLTLRGHRDRVPCVAFSPDGKTVASGGGDKTVRLWDVETGQPRATLLVGGQGAVVSLAFAADGRMLASWSAAGTVKRWDLATGKEQAGLKETGRGTLAVAFAPDGKTLAAAGPDRTVRLWDLTTGKEQRVLKGPGEAVYALAFAPDGQTLAVGSHEKQGAQTPGLIQLWDVATGEEQAALRGHADVVQSLAFAPDGKTLASASRPFVKADKPGEIKLWDVATGLERAALVGHTKAVLSLSFSPDGKTLAAGSADTTVRLWDTAAGREPRPARATRKGHTDLVYAVAFAPDGKTLASGSYDGTVKLWDADRGPERDPLRGHKGWVWSVAYAPDGKTLATGGMDGDIHLWDAATGQKLATLPGHAGGVSSLAFAPDGKTLAAGSVDKAVRLWDVAARKDPVVLLGHTDRVLCVAYDPGGKALASVGGSADNTVRVWDPATGETRAVLKIKGVRCVALAPGGQTLATGSFDRTVQLWNVDAGEERAALRGHTDEVRTVAFAPDGKTLATGSEDATVRLWDVDTAQERAVLKGHRAAVRGLAYVPDGRALATGGFDGAVRLWDVATGQERLTLQGAGPSVYCLAFAPDGRRLAAGTVDGTVLLWDAAAEPRPEAARSP